MQEKKHTYESEINDFKKNFQKFSNRKIVLYGIGRYTATLLSENLDFNFVGVMDRDKDKIGRKIYGLPILSEQQAESTADIIIINTVEAYWETIYKRIKNLSIPVYFRNGKKAIESEDACEDLEYWNSTEIDLRRQIENSDIISFDFFDTIAMRKVLAPSDMFDLIERELKEQNIFTGSFTECRKKSTASARKNATIEEIYEKFRWIAKITEQQANAIMQIEIDMELRYIAPRYKVLEWLKYAQEIGKTIYILSDMYVHAELLDSLLKKWGIHIVFENIWVSCEQNCCKADGSMWEKYSTEIASKKSCLHIGDNVESDIKISAQYGIKSFYVMSALELLRKSTISELEHIVCDAQESRIVGMIIYQLFQDPFYISETKGKLVIDSAFRLGYVVYGSVVCAFISWLIETIKKDKLNKVLFMARDGYFLYEDYQYYLSLEKSICSIPADYLYISRRAVIVASICNRESYMEAIKFPYTGTFEDYMRNRFEIQVKEDDIHRNEIINAAADYEKIYEWMLNYENELKKEITYERQNFKMYLNEMLKEENIGVVDLWFYGNTQYYLNHIAEEKVKGYYFATDLTPHNKFIEFSEMKACFQKAEDYKAQESSLRKKALITESFFTAPHGMVKYLNEKSEPVFDVINRNQEYFTVKEQINEGAKEFIKDYRDLTQEHTEICPVFADHLFGIIMKSSNILSDELQKSFWIDNGVVQQREFQIFES